MPDVFDGRGGGMHTEPVAEIAPAAPARPWQGTPCGRRGGASPTASVAGGKFPQLLGVVG
jgi:hypothetical protein